MIGKKKGVVIDGVEVDLVAAELCRMVAILSELKRGRSRVQGGGLLDTGSPVVIHEAPAPRYVVLEAWQSLVKALEAEAPPGFEIRTQLAKRRSELQEIEQYRF